MDDELIEGSHYSIMFYGGRLLSHLSGAEVLAAEEEATNLIHLLPLNRNMAIVIDSDVKQNAGEINSTKRRIVKEFADAKAYAWVTAGREIENYVSPPAFTQAVESVHRKSPRASSNPYASMFAGLGCKPNKVAIAQAVTAATGDVADILDLRERVSGLVSYIRVANGL
jgi:hypothetical protein